MTQAPERIWACPKHMLEWENSVDCSSVKAFAHDVEYVRGDLYASLEVQLAEAQALADPEAISLAYMAGADRSRPTVGEAAKMLVEAYDRANPMRTADFHGSGCGCIRCAVDALRALSEDTQ